MRFPTYAGCLVVLATTLAGCSRGSEAALIGRWQTGELTPMITAFKLKDENPSATSGQAIGGGKLLGTAALEISEDKKFELGYLGQIMEGSWTFDKQSGELLLNITNSQGILDKQTLPPGPWVAYMDSDNRRLRLYPGNKELANMMKENKGALADGIPLRKKND